MNKNKSKNKADTKKTKKRGKKIMTVLLVIISVIITINLISLFVNQVFFSKELDGIEPYGKLVEIDGGKMHIYSMGNGEKTIVLLPGMGVPLSSADFGPLMRELSKEYTVVCAEYFGYGFSDTTDIPRTNENYTRELREALSLAGFAAPYILMSHSASGIYSEYYATKYPNEVSAIIMLDTTSSVKEYVKVPKILGTMGNIQQAIGLGRLFNPIIVSSLGINEKNGYTAKEIEDFKKFYNHIYNNATNDQLFRFAENIREIMEMDFPNEVPVLKIIASKQNPGTEEDYHTNHIAKLGENTKLITLEGTHFIYHMAVTEIVKETISFLELDAR